MYSRWLLRFPFLPLCGSWAVPGWLQARFGPMLGALGRILASRGGFWAHLGRLLARPSALGGSWVVPGPLLSRSWALISAPGWLMCAPWTFLGRLLAPLGRLLERKRAILDPAEALPVLSGAVLGVLLATSGASTCDLTLKSKIKPSLQ